MDWRLSDDERLLIENALARRGAPLASGAV
jgi:hypothetical protein